jgi:hypothetical protein
MSNCRQEQKGSKGIKKRNKYMDIEQEEEEEQQQKK